MIVNHSRTVADLAAAGVTIPEHVTHALELLKVAKETILLDPTAGLRDEYDAGTLTPDNLRARMVEAATIAAASERIRAAATTIEQSVVGTVNAWLKADHDKIVKALRPAFDKAAAIVHAAGAHFAPGATPADVLRGGSAAAAAHEHLAEALSTLAHLRSLRVAVGDVANIGEQDVTWWITEARDLATLARAERAYYGAGNAFHALAAEGFKLRMNLPTEAAAVTRGARVTTEAEAKAAEDARLAAHRESWAPTLSAIAAMSGTADA